MKLIVVLLLCVTCLVDCHTKKMRKRKWMDYHRNNLSNGQLTTKNNGDASSTTKISRNGILTRNTNKPQNKRKLITPRGNRDHNMKLRPTRAANRRSKTNIPRRKSKNKNCNNNNKRKSKRTTSERIRENYNEARWIQKPMLYAFSTTEAEKFVSRFDEDLAVPVTSQCTNQKTKVSKKDIRDLGRILKTAQCSSTKDKDNSRRRKRRATLGPQTVVNPDGSITRIRKCVNRGVVTEKGYIRLCSQCHAVTELPNQMYPKFINEVICNPTDNGCLTGGGVCSEGTIKIPFLKDVNRVGEGRLSEWVKYDQSIRTSCNCGIRQGHVFQYFV